MGSGMKNVRMKHKHKAKKRKAVEREEHSLERARERFELTDIKSHDYKQLVKQIKSGEAKFLRNRSESISLWEVVLPEGKHAIAIFDKKLRVISTLMPIQWLEDGRI